MAYYFLCKKHNERMIERLDSTGTKIIPYCRTCECQKELSRINGNKHWDYIKQQDEIEKRYQEDLKKYNKELNKTKWKWKLLLLVSMLFCWVLGITLIIVGLADGALYLIVGTSIIVIGTFEIFTLFIEKPKQPSKQEIEYPVMDDIDSINLQFDKLFKQRQADVDHYKDLLKRQYENKAISDYELKYIDNMDGLDFEVFVSKLLKLLDYKEVNLTSKTGDYGADIIAFNQFNKKVAIQCKRWKNPVGNEAIQQIHSAKDYYDCDKSIVITTSNFTKSAIRMAEKLEVELWNRETLKVKIANLKKESWNTYLSKFYIKPTLKVNDEYVERKSF